MIFRRWIKKENSISPKNLLRQTVVNIAKMLPSARLLRDRHILRGDPQNCLIPRRFWLYIPYVKIACVKSRNNLRGTHFGDIFIHRRFELGKHMLTGICGGWPEAAFPERTRLEPQSSNFKFQNKTQIPNPENQRLNLRFWICFGF